MRPLAGAALAAALLAAMSAAAADFDAAARSARSLLEALVAADTTNPPGNEARAVALGAERLRAAGVRFRTSEFAPGRQNLVARLAGDGAEPPLLLLAHVDVVGTGGQHWSSDPHRASERDGYLYGRGVADDLGMAAVALEVLLLLERERPPLARDVILAWTGDEESGGAGLRWLLEHEPGSVEAAFALNEGGGIRLADDGRPAAIDLQTAEKQYQDFELVARGPTGHSSVPQADNAIYRLAGALERLSRLRFPARLLPVTRAWLAARAPGEPPERRRAMEALAGARGPLPEEALARLDADPVLSATLRTTCVATLVAGGSRANALPAEARATLNCRILPDETPEQVRGELARAIGDPALELRPTEEFGFAEPSPLEGPVPDAIRRVAGAMWPGIPLVPFMSRGATDSRFLRARGIPAYGINPIALGEADAQRAHGVDERIPAASLRPAVEFLYRLVVEIAGAPAARQPPAARGAQEFAPAFETSSQAPASGPGGSDRLAARDEPSAEAARSVADADLRGADPADGPRLLLSPARASARGGRFSRGHALRSPLARCAAASRPCPASGGERLDAAQDFHGIEEVGDLHPRGGGRIGAVHRVALDVGPEVAADGPLRRLLRVRGPHQLAVARDRALALEHADHDRPRGHEGDEVPEERALPVDRVEPLGLLRREVDLLQRDDPQARLLEAGEDLAAPALLDGVGLDDGQRALALGHGSSSAGGRGEQASGIAAAAPPRRSAGGRA